MPNTKTAAKNLKAKTLTPTRISIAAALRLYQNLRTDIYNALDFPSDWRALPFDDNTGDCWKLCDGAIVAYHEDADRLNEFGANEFRVENLAVRGDFTLLLVMCDGEQHVMIFANDKEVK